MKDTLFPSQIKQNNIEQRTQLLLKRWKHWWHYFHFNHLTHLSECFRVLLWLERDSSRKDGRSASQRSGQAVGVLGKFPQAPPRWKARYTSLGDRALWDRLGGTQPQHTRQRAFWISWFLKAYMGKYIQFLKVWYGLLINMYLFREA